MEGNGNKRRVLLIEGKRLVEGDPNMVTENEILLRPVVTEGKQSYMLVDNKGNILSSAPITSEDKWLYIKFGADYYLQQYAAAVCKTLDDYEQFVRKSSGDEGVIVHNGESLVIPEVYNDPNDVPLGGTIDEVKKRLKDICRGLPTSNGPFISIVAASCPINYLIETVYQIGALAPQYVGMVGAVYDRENDIWKDVVYD